ncbi:GPALPP motifs-containing protein 1 isoform X2 [Zophobas morio]
MNSDSDSDDSDQGIRYKTDSTRHRMVLASHCLTSRPRSRSPIHAKSKNRGRQLPRHFLDDDPEDSDLGSQFPFSFKHDEDSCAEPTQESSCIGPQLPLHLQKIKGESSSSSYGPQLPPHLKKHENPPSIGPYFPPHLRLKLQDDESDEEMDQDTYGPLPPGASITSSAQLALEERALQLKMDQLDPNKDSVPTREEWMVDLPQVKAANFGLGPRQFRSKPGPDMSDRSSWTDTPNTKNTQGEKVDLKREAEMREIRKRDEEHEKIAKLLKKKNKLSLVEMHQTKMMETKMEEGPSERRPFSRDIDLQVNRFDEAQKKAVLKKAQLLDDRFSSGQSKFL